MKRWLMDPRDARTARDRNATDAPVEPASTPAQTPEAANETASAPAPEVAPVEETPTPVVEVPPAPAPEPPPPGVVAAPAAPAPTPVATSWQAPLSTALEAKRAKKQKRLEQIVALAAKKRRITNNDVQLLIRVSDATATNYLRELVQTGRLKKTGVRAGTRYEPS